MISLHPLRLTIVVLGVLAAGAATVVRSEDTGQQPAAKEWTTVNGDLANTRYSALTQINRQTVSTLAGAWTSPKFDAVGAGRAMPVVKDGMLFITAGASVYAYDAKTGAKAWQHSTDRQP